MFSIGNTKVYFMNVESLADEARFTAMLENVSETRRKKVMAYRFMKDRCLSLGAELLLSDALADRANTTSSADTASAIDTAAAAAVAPLDFRYGDNEKPYLKGHEDIFFNLSHSGDYVMCTLSDLEVGCDIQKIGEANLDLAKRFFTEREYSIIADQPTDEERRDMFYRYWTLKESFMKATGLGMKLPLDSFEILISDRDRPDNITITQSVDDRAYTFTEFRDIPGYKAAVCTAG